MNRFNWGERSKIKLEELFVWGINLNFLFLFSFFFFLFLFFCTLIFLFILVSLLLYALKRLYSLGLCYFHILNHVRMLDLVFWSSALFAVLLGFLGWNLIAFLAICTGLIMRIHSCSYVRMILLKNLNPNFSNSFSYFMCNTSILDLSLWF